MGIYTPNTRYLLHGIKSYLIRKIDKLANMLKKDNVPLLKDSLESINLQNLVNQNNFINKI